MAEKIEVIFSAKGQKQVADSFGKIGAKIIVFNQGLQLTKEVLGAVVAPIIAVTEAFREYEKALIGVAKTTNMSGKELAGFSKEIVKLSKDLKGAASSKELLAIAQAAGQLGVKGADNLKVFSSAIAQLGLASDLSGETAATTLTRILTVTGEGTEGIKTFASQIVALGNNFAATESEIARVASEVARAVGHFGVGSGAAVALGAALKSVDVRAELAGSTVGKAFRVIDRAVRNGGQVMEDLSALTGKTGEQLKKTFQTDSVKTFQFFVEGLGRIQKAGGDVTAELEKFGLRGEEVLKVLPVIAKRSDLVAKALNMVKQEAENGGRALKDEVAAQVLSLDTKTKNLNQRFEDLQTTIGKKFAPAAILSIDLVTEAIVRMNERIDETKEESLMRITVAMQVGNDIFTLQKKIKELVDIQILHLKKKTEIEEAEVVIAKKVVAVQMQQIVNRRELNGLVAEAKRLSTTFADVERADAQRIADISKIQRDFQMRQLALRKEETKELNKQLKILGLAQNIAISGFGGSSRGRGGGSPVSPTPSGFIEGFQGLQQVQIIINEMLREADKQAAQQAATRNAAIGFGKQIGGQITGVGGAISGFESGGVQGAIAGFAADILLSNEEFQEVLAEISLVIQETFAPIIHEMIPILRVLIRVLRALSPAIKSLAVAITPMANAIVWLSEVIEKSFGGLEEALDALHSPLQKLVDALDKWSGGGGGGVAGEVISFAKGAASAATGGLISFAEGTQQLSRDQLVHMPGMESNAGLVKAHVGEAIIRNSENSITNNSESNKGGQFVFNISGGNAQENAEEIRKVIEELQVTGRLK